MLTLIKKFGDMAPMWIYVVTTHIFCNLLFNANAAFIRGIQRCYYPECLNKVVNSEMTREVFVTSCKINKVTVIGNPSEVMIRDRNQAICGKYIIMHKKNT
jgi:hypothetical protein